MESELRVFVYGTLKRGFSNHDAYCAGVLQIRPAWIYGRLYKLCPGIPAMIVPQEGILTLGTGGAAKDIEAQQELWPMPPAQNGPVRTGPSWKKVRGELLVFDDPEKRLPLLDDLEEFRPGGQSTYLRVLVRVNLPDGLQTTAWTYVGASGPAGLEELEGEAWLGASR